MESVVTIITVAVMKTATTAASTTTVPYSNTDCGLKDTVEYKVEENLQQLPCRLQDACLIDVQSKCDLSGSNRRRRSGGSVSVTVNLKADFGDSVTLDQSKLSLLFVCRAFLFPPLHPPTTTVIKFRRWGISELLSWFCPNDLF